jgi:hypothetical protein
VHQPETEIAYGEARDQVPRADDGLALRLGRSLGGTDERRLEPGEDLVLRAATVTARKDDAPAVVQAVMANPAASASCSGGGGLILSTSG